MSEKTRARSLRDLLEAEQEGVPFVVLEREHDESIVLTLVGDAIMIGRSSRCDVVIDDARVSRLHARLERVPGGWAVADEALSRNGTWVNGGRIAGRRRLVDGDRVTIGHSTLLFRSPIVHTSTTMTIIEEPLSIRMTPAQRRVLVALARPCWNAAVVAPATNNTIAEELFISVDTVKSHLKALFDQFEVGPLPNNAKRAQLVEKALRVGILAAEDFS